MEGEDAPALSVEDDSTAPGGDAVADNAHERLSRVRRSLSLRYELKKSLAGDVASSLYTFKKSHSRRDCAEWRMRANGKPLT